jgi:hypothetical protein
MQIQHLHTDASKSLLIYYLPSNLQSVHLGVPRDNPGAPGLPLSGIQPFNIKLMCLLGRDYYMCDVRVVCGFGAVC